MLRATGGWWLLYWRAQVYQIIVKLCTINYGKWLLISALPLAATPYNTPSGRNKHFAIASAFCVLMSLCLSILASCFYNSVQPEIFGSSVKAPMITLCIPLLSQLKSEESNYCSVLPQKYTFTEYQQ